MPHRQPHIAASPAAPAGHPELLYESERSRIVRVPLGDGARHVIRKQPLGPDAGRRLRHELMILERLAGVEGVPQLAGGASGTDAIALADTGGTALAGTALTTRGEMTLLCELARRLAEILAAVHRCGVVHRDINPANIIVAADLRTPTLVDFDLATTFAEERPGFTHESEIVGTLAYMAPEQTGRTGRPVDQRADLYALGATLYELATGQPPFGDGDALQLIHDHLATVPTAPAELNLSLPQGLSDIVMRLLEKEPDRRYQSAAGLAYDLTRLEEARQRGENDLATLGEHDFPLRLAPPSRLIGRGAEVAALHTVFEYALQGRERAALIAGAPGVGKTALIDELRPIVTASGGWFVAGKFDQYRHDAASDAMRHALRALGRLLLAEPEAELAALRAQILHALGPNVGLVAAVLPEFALLLEATPAVPDGDPQEIEQRLFQACLALLRAVASPTRPVVLVIDDLQWAGQTAIGLIDAVLTDESLCGVLLVGAYRDAEVDAAHPLSAMLSRWERLGTAPLLLALKNLPPADLGDMLEEMLRLQPSEATRLAEAIGPHTGGNPYDTVELVNALRRDQALVRGQDGWSWDDATLRRYVGQANVVDLLKARIERLPSQAQMLLETMACLGGEVALGSLAAASGLSATALEEQLAPALEDGLLVMEQGGERAARFRHDRVQQAAYGRLDAERRQALHLELARRLAALPEFETIAAGQYLPAAGALNEPAECRRVVGLFRAAAATARLVNGLAGEQFLTAAIALLESVATAGDERLLAALEIELHAVLYTLDRPQDADRLYASIERRGLDPLDLAEATWVQASSLIDRGQPREALDLGLALLPQLGVDVPAGDLGDDVARQMDGLYAWIEEIAQADGSQAAETADPRVLATAKLINRLLTAAWFCDPMALFWLMLASQRLWAAYGLCAPMVANLGPVGAMTIVLRQDHRTGYVAARHALAVGDARGYALETAYVRHVFTLQSKHWFEPLEDLADDARRAREGLLRSGDLQNVGYTYFAALAGLLDSGPTLEEFAREVDQALALTERTGNAQATASFLSYRQLLRALRGETDGPGSFTDAAFDEEAHLASLSDNSMAAAYFHVYRALAAALFGDTASLVRHAAEAMPLLPYIEPCYPTALGHTLQSLALAQRARVAEPAERTVLLGELDASRDWLALRAADAPGNFAHLVALVQAEEAWTRGDFEVTARAFDVALREAHSLERPWHRALIHERAARFHIEHGLEQTGSALLDEARRDYDVWGANAKVAALEAEHAFLGAPVRSGPDTVAIQRRSSTATSDASDLHAVLQATRALSSEPDAGRRTARLIEDLGAITGATMVRVVLSDGSAWSLAPTPEGATPISVEEAGSRGLLPLSAFRYAERTREPLLVDDAGGDDRFARDPYVAALDACSLLVIPIVARGSLRAMLLLENRLSRGAFAAERLDAVMLIAGQFAVSLESTGPRVTAPQPVATPGFVAVTAATPQPVVVPTAKRKAAETALRESETRFRSSFEFSSVGLALVGLDGRFTRVNPALAELLGYSVPELTGRSIADVCHPQDVELDQATLLALADGGEAPGPREKRYLHRSGRTVWVLGGFSAVREGGSITGFVTQVQDITERQLAEKALRESENLFRTAFEGTNVGMALVDADGLFTRVNEALAALLGRSPAELAGRRVVDLTHPDDRASGVAETGTQETRYVHRDGSAVWVLVSVSEVRDEHGAVTGRVLHVQSLDQRRQAEHERRRSEERYRSLVENLPLVTFRNALDDEGRNLYSSPQIEAMLGHPPSEWQADAQLFWQRLHPDDIEHVRAAFSRTARTSENLDCEYRMLTPDGCTRTIQQRGTVVLDADTDGKGLYLQGYMLDISEHRELEERLRLAQKLESVGQLAAGIAHEINTPIQFVADSVGFVSGAVGDLLELVDAYRSAMTELADGAVVERVRAAEDVADLDYLRERLPPAFDRATAGITRVATIVRTMKTSADLGNAGHAHVDVNESLQSALTSTRANYRYLADVETAFATLPPVFADGVELNQVFVNLIVNAAQAIADLVDATDDRGTIRVSSHHEGDEVIVRIGDTGAGIPDGVCQRIFDPFFTTKEVGGGTGQGLAVARAIIAERHGGTITVDSTVGVGTTFEIRLPVNAES